MTISRRRLVVAAALAAAAGFTACAAPAAQGGKAARPGKSWPGAGPITLIVPFAAGGEVDAMARLIGRKLSERLRQCVVVDNVPGAGGVLGVSKAVKSPADGYTLLMGSDGPVGIAQLLSSSVRYDTQRDLVPVGLVAVAPVVAVARPGLPAHHLQELIALARSRPGALSYATVGAGSLPHLAMEMLQERARVRMIHVPYRGSAQILSEVMGGQVDVGMLAAASATPLVRQKKLVGLGVTSAQRIEALPGVMGFGEVPELKGFELNAWSGLFAPAGTPEAVVARLSSELVQVLQMPEVRKALEEGGVTPGDGSAAEFAGFLSREKASYAQIVKSANMLGE
ncbi:MAG: tripartite tricarboxylate transporter substrate binding protein [Burkholderiaceae bacterium]|nr:tripartite tricarboxylate transporter substrate binding protein [Burkholderiaceae bacterium]